MALEKSKVQVNIPDDFVPIVDSLGVGTSLDDRVRLSLAVGLFASKAVSLAKAAELSGRTNGGGQKCPGSTDVSTHRTRN